MTSPAGMRGEYADTRCGRMHFREAGSGEPVVLIHGGQMDSSFWMRVGPLLAQGRRVIAPDMPPYGLSEAQPREPDGLSDLAEPLAALLETLEIERASVVGYHIGASLAIDTAARHGELVDKLILLGPFAAETQADRDAAFGALGFDFDDAIVADPVRLVRDFEAKVARPDDPDWYAAHLIGRLLAGPRSWWFYRALFRYDVVAAMSQIERPTLVVHLGHDALPEETARNALKHIQDSQWLLLEDADHYLALSDPQRLADVIAGFLDRE